MFKRQIINTAGIRKSEFSCTRGRLTLRGTEYRPVTENDSLPAAVVCHGFMAFQDTVRPYAEFLAELGYAAYCFDFAGGCVVKGKSDGKTTDMSVLTEVSDLEAVIAYVQSLPYTSAEGLLLMGCSQGGFVSALTAAKRDDVAKLVLFYPAFCIPDDARAGKMMFAHFDPENIPEIIRCGPMKLGRCYAADVIGMDPYTEIAGYRGDVLIVHGTEDGIVDIRYSERAAETYRAENRERCVQFQVIEKGQHGFSKAHDRQAMEGMERFLCGHEKI